MSLKRCEHSALVQLFSCFVVAVAVGARNQKRKNAQSLLLSWSRLRQQSRNSKLYLCVCVCVCVCFIFLVKKNYFHLMLTNGANWVNFRWKMICQRKKRKRERSGGNTILELFFFVRSPFGGKPRPNWCFVQLEILWLPFGPPLHSVESSHTLRERERKCFFSSS